MLEPTEIPEMEVIGSSNPENADNVLTTVGWKPKLSDSNPSVVLEFPEEYPIVEITFDTEDTTDVEVVVRQEPNVEVFRTSPEVGHVN